MTLDPRIGMWFCIVAAISNAKAANPQNAPRHPMASAASVPSGMPNSSAADMPR